MEYSIKQAPQNREPSKLIIEVDFLKPIDKEKVKEMADTDCFGKMYDITTKECNRCTLRDICCIVFQDALDLKVKALEEKTGSKFLDTSTMEALTPEAVFGFIKSGETKVSELVKFCSETGNTDDMVAITNFIKRFVKNNENVYTKEGIVWLR